MTTPSIEKMVEEIEGLLNKEGQLLTEDAEDYLRQALTQAHQAGIDEAVERVNRKLSSTIGAVKMGVISQEQGYNEIIKTLQDNK